MRPLISIAVEGPTDEAVVRRIAIECDLRIGSVHGLQGKPYLKKNILAFNSSTVSGNNLL